MKHELQNIISGKSPVRYGEIIQTIAGYLRRSKGAIKENQISKFIKQEEAKSLKEIISENNLWVSNGEMILKNYYSEGAEQKVYLSNDGLSVYKLNDSIFYNIWGDYFDSLLLHNYFFPDTAYELIGFIFEDEKLLAVVKQRFIKATAITDLEDVKNFMFGNGFLNTRNNDYYNPDLQIILEDLHDENVLTNDGVLFFIDTTFYLKDDFYNS